MSTLTGPHGRVASNSLLTAWRACTNPQLRAAKFHRALAGTDMQLAALAEKACVDMSEMALSH